MQSLYWRIVASKIESIQTRVMRIIFCTCIHYNEVLSAPSLTTLMSLRDESTFVRLRLQGYRTKTTRYMYNVLFQCESFSKQSLL